MVNKDRFNREEIRDFFDALYIGVHIVDYEGKTVIYNKKCEEIEGLERQWVFKRDIEELVRTGVYNESVALEVLNNQRVVKKTQKVNKKKYIFNRYSHILSWKLGVCSSKCNGFKQFV